MRRKGESAVASLTGSSLRGRAAGLYAEGWARRSNRARVRGRPLMTAFGRSRTLPRMERDLAIGHQRSPYAIALRLPGAE